MLIQKEYLDFVEAVEKLGITVGYGFSPITGEGLNNVVFYKDDKIKSIYFPMFMRVCGQSHIIKGDDYVPYTNKQYLEDRLHNLRLYFEINK